MIEIHSLEEFRRYLDQHQRIGPCVIQGLDLSTWTDRLLEINGDGMTFLGCRFQHQALDHLIATGGLVFPALSHLPYHPYRPMLYTQSELMEGFDPAVLDSFHQSRDSAIYRHFQQAKKDRSVLEALAQRLHDHAIDDALEALLESRSVVAIMGGHALQRNDRVYAQIAEIGRKLARAGLFVATGGGPGAMEAGNLGAWLAPYPDSALPKALEVLGQVNDYHLHDYLVQGERVRALYPEGRESLAIPTWFYGHEPTNQFCTHIAKYFSNSLREDGLLAIATRGVIYAPGKAGTVQEIFMDATQNHYGTFDWVSPMVFFGVDYWRRELPAEPLLRTLAGDRPYGKLILSSDDPDEVVRFIETHPPIPYS